MAPRTMFQRLSLICLISSTVPSANALASALSAAQALGVLEARDSTCANATSTSCSAIDSRLPNDICCKAGTTCLSTDNGSSAICCPAGIDCSAIAPITCDLTQQNPSTHPDAVIQTTKLNSTLAKCGNGNGCCPFGYTCSGGNCLLLIDSSVGFHQKGSPTSSSSSTSTTASSSANATGPSGIDSTKPGPAGLCNKFPAAAVAAGFFPGVLFGALLAILLVIFCGRRKAGSSSRSSGSASSAQYKKSHSRGYSQDNKYDISEPIPMETHSARSDFLGRTTSRAKSFFLNKSPRIQTNNSWKMPTPPVPNNIPHELASTHIPVTPERQQQVYDSIHRQSNTESITVYSPAPIAAAGAAPAAQIAPLRGMASQRFGHEPSTNANTSTIGSPFQSPPTRSNNNNNNNDNHHNNDPYQSSPYVEVLTPARYGDAAATQAQTRTLTPEKKRADNTRPNTTFTMVMEEAGMPDPLRGVMPAMPPIPRGLDGQESKKKKKAKEGWR